MGGPAGVADAGRAVQGLLPQQVLQIDQLSLAAADADLTIFDCGDAGRVITAVFKLFKPFQYDRGGILAADVSYDSTHCIFLHL
ncbi:MAG: hypothetical protein BWY83_03054 [bacterium ADurb.Bin478]|nr:MAG: hypothetical protein BWY83_03054 [bacterium ADurb.Bin478]